MGQRTRKNAILDLSCPWWSREDRDCVPSVLSQWLQSSGSQADDDEQWNSQGSETLYDIYLTFIRENFSFSKNIKYKDICKSQEKMVIVYWPSRGFMFDTDTG